MAEGTTQNPIRLTDWLVLTFVLVVMGLLIVDLGSNVADIADRDQGQGQGAATEHSEPLQ